MLDFLPEKFKLKLNEFTDKNLYEIRVRVNKNVTIIYKGKILKLNLLATETDVEEIVLNACKLSIYSYENQIKQGFITADNGERIGLSGEFVFNGENIVSIRNFTSLCIRIPCEVSGVSNRFYNDIYNGGSVLVVSKTGVGKTTFIRDLCKNISNALNNVVLIDERNEIAGKNQNFSFDVGDNTDVLTYASKIYGFNQAIRTLNPTYIITDELMTKSDCDGVFVAVNSGISVIATVHSDSLDNLKNKGIVNDLIINNCFDYYLMLKIENNNRKIEVFDKNLKYLCFI